jgi:outer membrane receptor protein involved in Fe transport
MQGAAVLNNAWTSGVQVDSNYVPFNALLDLRGSYRWTDNIQFYGAVDNVLDTPPPSIPDAVGLTVGNSVSGGLRSYFTNNQIYDTLGRVMRVGIRIAF